MSAYRISGVWKDSNNVITHYAFHLVGSNTERATKKSKSDAIRLVEASNNTVMTWTWNYNNAFWQIGEKVKVVHGRNGKYLRTESDNELKDNLAHLIDFGWLTP